MHILLLVAINLHLSIHSEQRLNTPSVSERHLFFEDVEEIRAQERARNDAKRYEVLERRQKQMEELAEKKNTGNS